MQDERSPSQAVHLDSNEPWIVSIDDHIVEPPHLWTDRLPKKYADAAPHIEQRKYVPRLEGGQWSWYEDPDGAATDCWIFEDSIVAIPAATAAVGRMDIGLEITPVRFDEMRPGCYILEDRIKDLDEARVLRSVVFPNHFVRFAGQRFLAAHDKDLGLACVQAYNDHVLEEWGEPSGGRVIPAMIVPLWDVNEVVREIERNAARGIRVLTFPELPAYLGLPSLYTGSWDPVWSACAASGVTVMQHIGSASQLPAWSPDMPAPVQSAAAAMNSNSCLFDWIFSGSLERFPDLKVCLAESQLGWVPYFVQRADQVWEKERRVADSSFLPVSAPPSDFARRQIWYSFFDDPIGGRLLDEVGRSQVVFEMDYPHGDTNWPNPMKALMMSLDGPSEETLIEIGATNSMKLLGLA